MLAVQPSILHVQTFGVHNWCKSALKSVCSMLMLTQTRYSPSISLLVRMLKKRFFHHGLKAWTRTQKYRETYTESAKSMFFRKVWPPLLQQAFQTPNEPISLPLPSTSLIGHKRSLSNIPGSDSFLTKLLPHLARYASTT